MPARASSSATRSRAELWSAVEPLFRSALDGETRSREIWTGERAPLPDGRRRAAAPGRGRRRGRGAPASPAAWRSCSTSPPAAAERLFAAPPAAAASSRCSSARRSAPACSTATGRWLLVNRALCEITGYTAEELIGKRFDGIMHPEDAVQRPRAARAAAGRARSPPSRSRSATSTRPARRSRRSSRCRSCATATARRCTTSPSCRTSPSASSSRSTCATSPTTIRSPACATAGCSSTTCTCRSPARSATARLAGLMVIDLDAFKRGQRQPRPQGRRRHAQVGRAGAHAAPARNGPGGAARRRRVRGAACRTSTTRASRSSPRVSRA